MIFDEEVAISSDNNLLCSLLISLSNSACRTLLVLMKSFLSRQWESWRSEERHSAEKVEAHGICSVMRPSLVQRKMKSPFLPSNLHRKTLHRKTNTGKILQKELCFQPSDSFENLHQKGRGKMNSAANGMGKKEPPSIHRRGLNQNVNWRHWVLMLMLSL